MLMVACTRLEPTACECSRTAVQRSSASASGEVRRRAGEHGGELVASHAGQCLVRSKALREYVRDAPDQSLRVGRAVPPDHLAISVYVDAEKRDALTVLAERATRRSSSCSKRRRFHRPVRWSWSAGSRAPTSSAACSASPSRGRILPFVISQELGWGSGVRAIADDLELWLTGGLVPGGRLGQGREQLVPFGELPAVQVECD